MGGMNIWFIFQYHTLDMLQLVGILRIAAGIPSPQDILYKLAAELLFGIVNNMQNSLRHWVNQVAVE